MTELQTNLLGESVRFGWDRNAYNRSDGSSGDYTESGVIRAVFFKEGELHFLVQAPGGELREKRSGSCVIGSAD
jgi:hypothetical protein